MCFGYGCTQWQRPIEVAPPPTKEEDIYLDQWTNFYPDYRNGIHPPGPIYQGNGYSPYGMQPGMYAGGGMCAGMTIKYLPWSSPFAGYGTYGAYGAYGGFGGYGGYGNIVPQPMCPASMTSQAAAAAAANKTLAQMPNGPNYYVGGTPADMAAQQAIVANTMGMVGGGGSSMAPYKPSDGQQFWCKELDGSWTLRSYSGIALGDVSPGHWERHAISGYYFWVRQPA